MRLTFLGAARQVTGSCYLVETDAGKILVDCGMVQGGDHPRVQTRLDLAFKPAELRWVLLTHAHLDHCGLLPRLVAMGYDGPITCTSATADLAEVILKDSAKLQEEDAAFDLKKWRKRGRNGPPPEPLYNMDDVERTISHVQPVDYDLPLPLTRGLQARFLDAGHISGGASIVLSSDSGDGVRLAFSGDLGYPDRPILRDPVVPQDIDYLVMEATYGDRQHESAEASRERFAGIIERTAQGKGALLIPTFAVGRAQELLYDIGAMIRSGRLRNVPPIFLDSPMAIEATDVLMRHPECFDDELRQLIAAGVQPFQFRGVQFCATPLQSQKLNQMQGPFIVMAGAGMCNGGRIRHHLLHHLERREDTILFVGFQASGTLGRIIKDGAKSVRLFGQELAVKARVEFLDGFSAHADSEQLLKWLAPMRSSLKRVFLTHGEPQAIVSLSDQIKERYHLAVMAPEMDDTVDLAADEQITQLARRRGRDLSIEAALANFGTA